MGLRLSRVGVGAVAVLALAGSVLAEGSTPAEFPAITFPVSIGSIVTTVIAAGVILFTLTMGPRIGMLFVRTAARKLASAAAK